MPDFLERNGFVNEAADLQIFLSSVIHLKFETFAQKLKEKIAIMECQKVINSFLHQFPEFPQDVESVMEALKELKCFRVFAVEFDTQE